MRVRRLVLVPAGALVLGISFFAGVGSPASADSVMSLPLRSAIDLQELARTNPNMAGLTFDELGHVVTVHVPISGDAGLARLAISALVSSSQTASADGWSVRFDSVSHSTADLQEVLDSVHTASPFAQLASSTLSQWSIDPATNTVLLGFTGLRPEVMDAATAAFGDRVTFAVIPRGDQTNRLADTAPFYSGDRLTMANGSGCTSGFALTIKGTVRMLSAGHCDLSGTVKNGSTTVGSVISGSDTDGGWDTEVISGSFAPWVFNGPVTTTTVHSVAGSFLPPEGFGAICTDGSFTGENCSGQVVVNNQGICHTWSSGRTTCHLGELVSMNGTSLSTHGDSGGPVYRIGVFSTSDLEAVGTIEGATTSGQYVWYDDMPELLSHWSGTLLTW